MPTNPYYCHQLYVTGTTRFGQLLTSFGLFEYKIATEKMPIMLINQICSLLIVELIDIHRIFNKKMLWMRSSEIFCIHWKKGVFWVKMFKNSQNSKKYKEMRGMGTKTKELIFGTFCVVMLILTCFNSCNITKSHVKITFNFRSLLFKYLSPR